MITDIDDRPFDERHANYLADLLYQETGRRYRATSFGDGYGVVRDTVKQKTGEVSDIAPTLYLRPAIQSQLWNILLIITLVWAYVSAESLMARLGLDDLREMLFNAIGWSFPWTIVVSVLEKLTLIIAIILSGLVFYNLASRSYMIGPKGVESSVGLFNKDDMRVEFKHVRGMRLRRRFHQRLLFYGTIEVATSGTDGSEIQFNNIATPTRYMAILKARAKAHS